MHLRGIIQSAALEESPRGGDVIDMVLRVQGVGPGQPRRLVIPYELLLEDPTLEPDAIVGLGFEADVDQAPDLRWTVNRIRLSGRFLRPAE